MKAVVIEGTEVKVKEVPTPQIKANEVLIKTKAVAINPTDWKHVTYQFGREGGIVGCDFAGEVVEVGEEAKGQLNVGDQGFGLVSGASPDVPEVGGFAEYVPIDYRYVLKSGNKLASSKESQIPAGPVTTFEAASSLPVALLTVVPSLSFFDKLKLEPTPTNRDKFYLVWGGSSSVGAIAVQFAKYLGFRVVATCSPQNSKMVESFGAEKTFDYKDPKVVSQIKEYVGDNVAIAYDTISTEQTLPLVNDVLPTDKPARLDATLGYEEILKGKKKSNVDYSSHLAYLCKDDSKKFGANATPIPSPPGLREASRELIKQLNTKFLKDGDFVKHLPCRVLSNGFDSISEGLDLVRTGKNSGEKIVINNI